MHSSFDLTWSTDKLRVFRPDLKSLWLGMEQYPKTFIFGSFVRDYLLDVHSYQDIDLEIPLEYQCRFTRIRRELDPVIKMQVTAQLSWVNNIALNVNCLKFSAERGIEVRPMGNIEKKYTDELKLDRILDDIQNRTYFALLMDEGDIERMDARIRRMDSLGWKQTAA